MSNPSNSYVLDLMESNVKSKVHHLLACDRKSLPDAFRLVNEAIQEYCTYRTLFEKYTEEQTDEKSDNK